MKITSFIVVILWSLCNFAQGPYAPAADQAGTSAIHKDSSIIIAWAKTCTVIRGYQDIANPNLGRSSVGDSTSALGIAQTSGVVSLGDSGFATVTFDATIYDGPSWDFVVFENGFEAAGGGDYLELAFVEVSSDGQNFFRFPSHSLSDTSQSIGGFGTLDPTNLNNLAGKYLLGYGTPFDLNELSGIQGLNINAISHIRIVDVVGSNNPAYASRDTAARKIVDPYPTPFPSGGFDLDAVAAIHMNPVGLKTNQMLVKRTYPNPVVEVLQLEIATSEVEYQLYDNLGKRRLYGTTQGEIDLTALEHGIYLLQLFDGTLSQSIKVLKQ